MTATWRAPVTWQVGQLVTATNLNEQLRDNLEFLKTPPTALYLLDEAADYATTSTSFVDVDAARLNLSIVTAGGDAFIGFFGTVRPTSSTSFFDLYFDVLVDGAARIGGDHGLCVLRGNSDTWTPVSFVAIKQGLLPGTHSFKLQWRLNSSTTANLYAGAGTSDRDVHPQFWVRELS